MRHATEFFAADPRLPPRLKVDSITACGLLRALEVSVYYRENCEALTNSTAPWEPGTLHPFVIEVDFHVPDRDDYSRWLPITVTYPSQTGPGTEGFREVVRAAVYRVMCHEADEGLLFDGARVFDPHTQGP